MECYEGATMIKSFRGLIVDGGQDTIVLHTNDGSTGYRIVKFKIFPSEPGQQTVENTVMIWKIKQAAPSTSTVTVDFSNQVMLAVATFHEGAGDARIDQDYVIFDREIFNQDIHLTHTDTAGAIAVNYYLELEQVKLDLNSNTVATLKDMRNTATPLP